LSGAETDNGKCGSAGKTVHQSFQGPQSERNERLPLHPMASGHTHKETLSDVHAPSCHQPGSQEIPTMSGPTSVDFTVKVVEQHQCCKI
jgi:hypothetical protein